MKLSVSYWLHQAVIGLGFVFVIALLGHLNYAQWRLMPGITGADWYFLISWLCFPFAKWVILEDKRDVQAPTIRRRKKRRAADATSSVYERMNRPQREPRLEAAPKAPLKWYWRVLLDVVFAFLGPLLLGGYVTYSLRHN